MVKYLKPGDALIDENNHRVVIERVQGLYAYTGPINTGGVRLRFRSRYIDGNYIYSVPNNIQFNLENEKETKNRQHGKVSTIRG